MSCQDAIGVFDSGLGGLSAVKEFLHVLPNEKIIYFGDTGRVPYGNRSRETISKYALQDANFLLKHNVKTVVAACGTVSSVAGDMLEEKLSVPYTGVVNPTAFIADRKTKNGKIGIIGTAATISSHSYKLRLEKLNPKYKVYEQACPLLFRLLKTVSSVVTIRLYGLSSEDIFPNSRKQALTPSFSVALTIRFCVMQLLTLWVTALRLLIRDMKLQSICSKILRENNLLNTDGVHQTPEFYVSDTPDGFKSVAGLFLGRNMEHTVTQIDIEQY